MAEQQQNETKEDSVNVDCKPKNASTSSGIHITHSQLIQILIISIIGIYVAFKYPKSVNEMKPFITEMIETLQNITNESIDKFNKSYTSLSPSQTLLSQSDLQIHEKHPIIMIPGLTSTPLKLWTSQKQKLTNDEIDYFYKTCKSYTQRTLRQRIWGSAQCAVELARDTNCWLLSMMINETTGLDSSFVKVRPVEGGVSTIDFLFPLIWIFDKIINNLAQIGYDSNLIYVATYDWRLAFKNLEIRDMYFSRLKLEIELKVKLNGEKAVMMGHSMGGNVANYFMQWVDARDKQWVDKYIESILFLASPLLGVPKYVSMALSGECLEMLLLPPGISHLKEWVVPRSIFNRFARSVHSAMYLQPIGGNKIWGNNPLIKWSINDKNDIERKEISEEYDNLDIDDEDDTFDKIMNKPITDKQKHILNKIMRKNYTADNWLDNTIKKIDKRTHKHISGHLEHGFPDKNIDISDDIKYGNDRYFGNILWRPLPNAPNLKIYCFYGVDLKAEIGYYYERDYNSSFKYPFRIDPNVQINNENEIVINGVSMGDGDGTVPLISLGFMCNKAWKNKRWNPYNVQVKTVEYKNVDELFIYKGTVRGGAQSGEHVDILGNEEMIKDILMVASGNGNKVKESVYSNIKHISNAVDLN